MENEELIRKQMEDTRSSITEKLETLEQKVSGDIQGATGAVTGTVEAVKETVETVKDSVTETVETVKESVAETAETVKEAVQEGLQSVSRWFDVSSHVQNYPWLSMGVAAGAGFLLESVVAGSSGRGAVAESAAQEPTSRAAGTPPPAKAATSGFSVFSAFAPQLSLLKQVAVSALLNAIKEPVLKAVPSQREGLAKLFDSLGEKLLGEEAESETPAPSAPTGYSMPSDSNGGGPAFTRSRPGNPLGMNHGHG